MACTICVYFGNAFNHTQLVNQAIFYKAANFTTTSYFGGESVHQNRTCRQVYCLYYGLVNIVRQTTTYTSNLFTYFRGHILGVNAKFKFKYGFAIAFENCRRKCFNTSNLADTVLDRFSNECFHFLRGSTVISYTHTYQGQVYVRCQVYTNIWIAADTEYYQHQNKHGSKYGSTYKCTNHVYFPALSSFSTLSTLILLPSRSLF